jgi:hypothetical protein
MEACFPPQMLLRSRVCFNNHRAAPLRPNIVKSHRTTRKVAMRVVKPCHIRLWRGPEPPAPSVSARSSRDVCDNPYQLYGRERGFSHFERVAPAVCSCLGIDGETNVAFLAAVRGGDVVTL